MNTVAIIRIAKIAALVGFLLPWVLVSCSNQPILTASGVDLGIGSFNFHNPMTGATEHHSGAPNMLILLAIVAAVGGLLFSFSGPVREVMGGLAISSAAGLLLSYIGLQAAKGGLTHQFSGEAARQHSDLSLEGLLSFQSKAGFAVTVVGFGSALAVSLFAIWSRRAGTTPEGLAQTLAERSADLAKGGLRQAMTVLSENGAAPRNAPRYCTACGGPIEPDAKFCSGCGSALNTQSSE